MAKSGTANRPLANNNINLERSSRFEKTLGLFSENDQKLLINSSPEEFRDFLGKKGFPAEDLLEARDAWISQGGATPGLAQQNQENSEQDKDERQSHREQHSLTEEEADRIKRAKRINDLLKKAKDKTATENEAKELENLKQEQRLDELEQKAKDGKISDPEKGELEKIKQERSSAPKTEAGKKPQIKPGGKMWGEGTGFSEPAPRSTITRQTFSRENITNRIKALGRPNQAAGRPASSMWGEGTGFSEPISKPAVNIPSNNIRSLGQRLPRPSFRPLTRTTNVFNRGAKSSGRVARAGSKVAGKVVQAGTRLAAQGLRALLTNPYVLGFLAILGIVILLILIIASYFTSNPGTSVGTDTNCNTGLCYYVDGPDQVDNGAKICYSITVIVDTDKVPNYSTLTLFDTYSTGPLDFSSATGQFTPTAPSGEVDWLLGSNTSETSSAPPTGSSCITAAVAPITASQKAFYFFLTLQTKASDATVENAIGMR